jgi:hypothetical protein
VDAKHISDLFTHSLKEVGYDKPLITPGVVESAVFFGQHRWLNRTNKGAKVRPGVFLRWNRNLRVFDLIWWEPALSGEGAMYRNVPLQLVINYRNQEHEQYHMGTNGKLRSFIKFLKGQDKVGKGREGLTEI